MSCQPLLPFQETLQKLRGTQWVSCARNIRTVAHFLAVLVVSSFVLWCEIKTWFFKLITLFYIYHSYRILESHKEPVWMILGSMLSGLTHTHTDTQKMVRYKDWKEQKVGLEKALRTIAQSHFLKMSRNCGSLESLVCLLTEFWQPWGHLWNEWPRLHLKNH